MRGVFFCSFKIAFNHIIMTWMLLDAFNQELSFLSAFLAGFVSVVPLFNPLVIIIPYCINLYMSNQLIMCVSLAVINSIKVIFIFVSGKIHTDVL